MQRIFVDLTEGSAAGYTVTVVDQAPFRRELDVLAEAVAVVRLVVTDDAVVAAAEAFEAQAKDNGRSGDWGLRQSPFAAGAAAAGAAGVWETAPPTNWRTCVIAIASSSRGRCLTSMQTLQSNLEGTGEIPCAGWSRRPADAALQDRRREARIPARVSTRDLHLSG